MIFNFFSHISAAKMMFWALARVSFRAAKIVSCNKNYFFHGLRSKLPQLIYFSWVQPMIFEWSGRKLFWGHFVVAWVDGFSRM
jgi:hypothetical protein